MNNVQNNAIDWILWISLSVVSVSYIAHFFMLGQDSLLAQFTSASYELVNLMYIGVIVGAAVMGLLARVPRKFVMSLLGTQRGLRGIWRATLAGLLFDVCSHGIMMVGAKLYERGATLGQVMAFLIASPWNSISLTIILFSLIGVQWTVTFIVLSAGIGMVSGVLFDLFVSQGILPPNHNMQSQNDEGAFDFWQQAKAGLKAVKWTPRFFLETFKNGFKESVPLIRWLLLGIVITAVLRTLLTPGDMYHDLFGPTVMGLFVTLAVATVIEVCSEGAVPIAGDIFLKTGAIGNTFTFLMAGVATNYTTFMILREATKSWKIVLFLPLVTVPQVLLFGFILNQFPAL